MNVGHGFVNGFCLSADDRIRKPFIVADRVGVTHIRGIRILDRFSGILDRFFCGLFFFVQLAELVMVLVKIAGSVLHGRGDLITFLPGFFQCLFVVCFGFIKCVLATNKDGQGFIGFLQRFGVGRFVRGKDRFSLLFGDDFINGIAETFVLLDDLLKLFLFDPKHPAEFVFNKFRAVLVAFFDFAVFIKQFIILFFQVVKMLILRVDDFH